MWGVPIPCGRPEQVGSAKVMKEQLGPVSPWQSIPRVTVASGAPEGKTVTVPSHFMECVWSIAKVGLLCGCFETELGGLVGQGCEKVAVPPAVGQVISFFIILKCPCSWAAVLYLVNFYIRLSVHMR